MFFKSFNISRNWLIHIVTIMLVLFYNVALFRHFIEVYPLSLSHLLYLFSIGLLVGALIEMILHLSCYRWLTKPVLILILFVSAMGSYFMDTYNIVLDSTMIENIFSTNSREAADLLSIKLFLYILILGILPAILIYTARIKFKSVQREIFDSSKIILLAIFIIVSQVYLFGSFYSSFFREHKEVRVYANPIMYLYSLYKYTSNVFDTGRHAVAELGKDSRIPDADIERELVIIIVGETARADKFSLNGYTRKTNPLLEKENVYSFNNIQSCGTSTAVSVPCMFSHLPEDEFTIEKGRNNENLLDVLQHAETNILWRDNNSDSKKVALRVQYEDFTSKKRNPVCDIECRDIGMLHGLQDYLDSKKEGDVAIVLHQMGNHGPAYYKRYPASFEKFTPACHNSQLDKCSKEEIVNAYDNAILYTDYFLSEVIKLLKTNTRRFETAMVYISDHGESLGENGVYLHGMPNFMAPDNQRKVGSIFWFGDSYDNVDRVALAKNTDQSYTHDNVFHTILGLFEIKSSVYDESLDIIEHVSEHE